MSDRLDQMETFVRVVEAGSLTAAARRMDIAKSAVSRRLRGLETRLGVQLLRRTTRRISVTASGQDYYRRCQRILADVDEAEAEVSDVHGRLVGMLRVAAPLSFGVGYLQPAVAAFQQRHPDVRFDLDLNDRQVDLLAEGFDLGLRIVPLPLPDSTLMARLLATIPLVVCASPGYLARRGMPAAPEVVPEHDCLVYSETADPDQWRCIDPQGHDHRLRLQPRMRANNGDFLREMACAGHGLTLQPRFLVHDALTTGRLETVLGDCDWSGVGLFALYPQTRHLSARVRVFIDFLADYFATPPWQPTP